MRFGKRHGNAIDQNVPEYLLSEAAVEDLIEIARDGYQNFGSEQSESYRDMLKNQFSAIAANPQHYVNVGYIKQDYRRCVCEAHAIYYRIEDHGVLIVRVLGQQDTSNAF